MKMKRNTKESIDWLIDWIRCKALMLMKSLQSIKSYHDTLLCGYKASPGSYKLTGNLFQSPDTDIEVHIRNLYIPKNNLKGKKFIKFKVDQLIKRSFWFVHWIFLIWLLELCMHL